MSESYDVGYKKPPKHGQFKPGESGNPKGKPKGAKNLKTELEEELQEKIVVKEGGKPKNVSKQRAMLKSLMAKAVQGDPRSANAIISMAFKLLSYEDNSIDELDLTATDQAILEAFASKILSTTKSKKKEKSND